MNIRLTLLLALVLFAMARVACLACGSDFKDKGSLARHRPKCKSMKTSLQNAGKEGMRRLEEQAASKVATAAVAPGGAEVEVDMEVRTVQFLILNLAKLTISQITKMDIDPPEPREPSPAPPPPTRSGRRRRLPKRLDDFLPSSLRPVLTTGNLDTPAMREAREQQEHTRQAAEALAAAAAAAPVTPECEIMDTAPPRLPLVITEPNSMGLYREYPAAPFQDPDDCTSIDQLCDAPTFERTPDDSLEPSLGTSRFGLPPLPSNPFAPFLNATIFRLINWFYSGSEMKSVAELDRLVKEVLLADDFDRLHLEKFSASRELDRLDKYEEHSPQDTFKVEDGWQETSVKIKLPAEDNRPHPVGKADAPELEVQGFFFRSLLDTVKAGLRDASSRLFHHTPFRLYWKPDENAPPSTARPTTQTIFLRNMSGYRPSLVTMPIQWSV